MELKIKAPAKINLFLSVTGKREDGYHNLVSVVAPLNLCDELFLRSDLDTGVDSMICDMEGVPCDETNLVLKATKLFRKKVDFSASVHFRLNKVIPHGAGLGGGSSDAVAALRLLNKLNNYPLSDEELSEISLQVGSDCPLFIKGTPLVMRGRGDLISECSVPMREYLDPFKVFIIKPSFSINTAWAYNTLAEKKKYYLSEKKSEESLVGFYEALEQSKFIFTNSFQGPVFDKHLIYGEYLSSMKELGLPLPCLSGSGSAVFQLIHSNQIEICQEKANEFFGENVFSIATSFF